MTTLKKNTEEDLRNIEPNPEKLIDIFYQKKQYGKDIYWKYIRRLEELNCFRRFLDIIQSKQFLTSMRYRSTLIESNEEGDEWRLTLAQIWVPELIYNEVKSISNVNNLKVKPERLCRMLLEISIECEKYEIWKSYKSELQKKINDKKEIYEVGRFREYLERYNRRPQKNSKIEIYVNNTWKADFDGNIVLKGIEDWLKIYVKHFNSDIEKKFNHYNLNLWSDLPPYKEVYQTYFRLTVVSIFDEWFKSSIKDNRTRYKVIAQLLALKNIFNLKNKTTKFQCDTINNALTRKPRTTLEKINYLTITHIKKDLIPSNE
jgi:hypothetical protein